MHENGAVSGDGTSAKEYASETPHSSQTSTISSYGGRSTGCSSSHSSAAASSGSSDDSRSTRTHDKLTLYEANIARQLLALKEGVPTDIIQPRKQRQFIEEIRKDAAYWERRRKNNEAAKRSREKRRMNDMAMEAQISGFHRDLDVLRRELVAIKQHFGLHPDQPFIPSEATLTQESNGAVQATRSPGSPMTHGSGNGSAHPSGTQHVPLMVSPHDPSRRVVLVPRIIHSMYQMPLHPSSMMSQCTTANVTSPLRSASPIQRAPSVSGEDAPYWPSSSPGGSTDRYTDKPYGMDDMAYDRNEQYKSSDTSPPDDSAFSTRSARSDDQEQDKPLNLVMDSRHVKETSEELSLRMHEEAARRYEEIKAGSVERADRDSGVVSPGDSSSSTSSGSPYSKRLRIDESDSLMEAESISTGSENNSSESFPPPKCAVDLKHAERRKRNNEASRRSRENRKHVVKAREEKTDVLELENSKLREELNTLASEVSNLRRMIEAKHSKNSNDGNTAETASSQ